MYQDLIDRKLVQRKSYANGLDVYKYTRKVFYDALWNEDPRLLDVRGMVMQDDVRVIWPFTKIFNYEENNTFCESNVGVVAVEKVNGFMACARLWNNELVVSTTGTLDSTFADLARQHLEAVAPADSNFWKIMQGFTLMFEICDESDPHIVDEVPGAYLIGCRRMSDGQMFSEEFMDWLASQYGFLRPDWEHCVFWMARAGVRKAENEGVVIRDPATGELIMKIKSPHYLTKKFIMRMGDNKVDVMFDDYELFKQTIDEEYYDLTNMIVTKYNKDDWKVMSDQERRYIIEEFFEEKVE